MINPWPGGAPVYAQLADSLRTEILTGRIRPGRPLPSERTLQQEYGLGRHTIRKAVGVLRSEGLVTMVKGLGMVVRERAERQELTPPPGSAVTARMPSAQERERFGLDEGIPVIVVEDPGGDLKAYPADRWLLRWP